MTDDKAYLWVNTMDGRVSRVNADTFAIDMTATNPGPLSQYVFVPTAIPVPGTSSTIVAAGIDGVVRIFDSGVQRGFGPEAIQPTALSPDAAPAVGSPVSERYEHISLCMVRGFASENW